MRRVRVKASPEDVVYDGDDKLAQVLSGSGTGLNDGVLRGDPDGERARRMVATTVGGEFPESFREMLADVQHAQILVPVCDAAINVMGISAMKSQARKRLTRKGHEWIDEVFYINSEEVTDKPHIAELPLHMANAVAAGITPEAIEAYRDGRLDDLADDDRQYVDFILAVRAGTVTDELWQREVELVGSERAVVEQLCMIILLNTHVRLRQAVGAPGITDDELAALIESFRSGERPPGNVDAYEEYYDAAAWPRLPDGY